MKPPAFWWRAATPQAAALAPLGQLYGRIAARQMSRPPAFRAPLPVVCIGNFTLGGTGKTPTALAVAALARGEGMSPGFLIRGYGGTLSGPVLADPARHTSVEIGDEALLLARAGPTVVGGDRAAGAQHLLASATVDLIVMDDGFQNPGLARDLSIAVVDAATGVGNGRVFPAGPLRAPLEAQLMRADAILLMGEGRGADAVAVRAAAAGKPVLRAAMVPAEGWAADSLPVLAYAGIGRPEKFFAALSAAGAGVARTRAFPDHHRFTAADAERLLREAEAEGLRLVTTEKDLARLAGATGPAGKLREASAAFAIRVVFADPAAVLSLLRAAERRSARPADEFPVMRL